MFYIIYNTSSKYIISAFNDTSTVVDNALEPRLLAFTKLNKLKVDEHSIVELPHDEDVTVRLGRDMFNIETNTIYPDPNWVPPPPEPTPTEPTA